MEIGYNESRIGKILVQELLSKKRTFTIPDYQRGYRWSKKQVEALIRDLSSMGIDDTNQYSLQPIVLQKYNDKIRVVDGQQRLTTIKLLFDTKENIEITLEDNNQNEDSLSKIYKGVTSIIARKNGTTIDSIQNKLNNIYFIWYLLDSKEDGNLVFQRLNSGKIPLTNSELIRALYFSSSIESKFQTEIAAEWEQIETRLRDDNFWYMFNSHDPEVYT